MGVSAKDFLSKEEEREIAVAISTAEKDTSGEIRVHIENTCKGEVLDRAAYLFKKLGMQKTDLRNGVLIYLAIRSHKFAIIGDQGINSVVPPDFWNHVKEKMLELFQKEEFAKGLCYGIYKAGEHLKAYFPYKEGDVNELPDEISYGKH